MIHTFSKTGSVMVRLPNGMVRSFGPGSTVNFEEVIAPGVTMGDALGAYKHLFIADTPEPDPAPAILDEDDRE